MNSGDVRTLFDEYAAFIQSLGSEFTALYPSLSHSSCQFISFRLDHSYIIKTIKREGNDLQNVADYYQWSRRDQPFMIFNEANDWKTKYGDLISVSPSGQYYAFVQSSESINGFVLNIIRSDLNSFECSVPFENMLPARGLFSGFGWNEMDKKLV